MLSSALQLQLGTPRASLSSSYVKAAYTWKALLLQACTNKANAGVGCRGCDGQSRTLTTLACPVPYWGYHHLPAVSPAQHLQHRQPLAQHLPKGRGHLCSPDTERSSGGRSGAASTRGDCFDPRLSRGPPHDMEEVTSPFLHPHRSLSATSGLCCLLGPHSLC